MKLTNMEILNAKAPLTELIGQQFLVKVSLALVKLVQKLNEFLIPIEQVRDGLVKMYGKPDPKNPNQISIEPGDEGWAKFTAEFKELLSEEVEVVFQKVTLPDTLKISPAVLIALEKFVKTN